MADKTGIEWCDATWNPVVGCSVVSPGCTNCYAMKTAAGLERRFGSAKYAGLTRVVNGNAVWTGEVRLDEGALDQPLRWRRPRRIFVNSMSDLFHEALPDHAIDRVFAVMAAAHEHTFLVLTKRPRRMRRWFAGNEDVEDTFTRIISRAASLMEDGDGWWSFLHERGWPLPNVWLGVSVEDQARADERIPLLLDTPAAKRFLSCEPLLGPVDLVHVAAGWPDDEREDEALRNWRARNEPGGFLNAMTGDGLHSHVSADLGDGDSKIDWVIAGGESGPGARPMHPDWARSLRDQCQAGGVPFFFKQWGEWGPHKPVAGGDLGGDVRAGRVTIVHPTAQSDVEVSLVTGGRNTIPGSRFMGRVGKRAAGRLLDGREWSEFPAGA